jgi:general secretion pathway protein G
MRTPSSNRRGFTLAELMVVVVILGLLATLVVKNVVPMLFKAKKDIAKTEVMNIAEAVRQYMINNGRLPETLDALVTPDQNNLTYIQDRTTAPADPWGFPYWYHPDSNGMSFEIGTYGRDGEPGGEGDNEDITSRSIANERQASGGPR